MQQFLRDIFKGRTIYRVFLDKFVLKHCQDISGDILDLAGGGQASYYDYLPKDIKFLKTNIYSDQNIDQIIDFNKNLPFEDNYFDNILFFNALYIVEDIDKFLVEVHRILKPGGKIFISSPFIANEMPEPHDYCRLTYEGLEKYFKKLSWNKIQIFRFGERFTAAIYFFHKFFIFNFIRFLVYSLAILLDKLIPTKFKVNYPTPLGYFCILKK